MKQIIEQKQDGGLGTNQGGSSPPSICSAPHDQQRQWLDYAFMYLGMVRDNMTPEQIEVVQHFLDGKFNKQNEKLTDRERATELN